jgi:hypothetical protein
MGIEGIIDITGGKEEREGLKGVIDTNLVGVREFSSVYDAGDVTRIDFNASISDAWWEWDEELTDLHEEAKRRGLSIEGTVTRFGEERDEVEKGDLSDKAITFQRARLVFPDGSEA